MSACVVSGGPAKGGLLYARVQGSDTVMTIPSAEVAHLSKLMALAGKTS